LKGGTARMHFGLMKAGWKAVARHGHRLLPLACCLCPTVVARAQDVGNDEPHTLAGHVMHAEKGGLAPVRGVMVTLHRVGADRAGPIDSMRTGADGHYTFTFRPSGNADAVYLASVGYHGIIYFSTPASTSQGVPDGDITVFDTTSGPVPIRTAGHHIIVSAPRGDALREIEEVYELSNDSSVTRVARGDRVPVWSATAPDDVSDIRGAPTPDIAPAAILVRGREVELYAPISPGMRQLAYGYKVRAGGFPLTLPLRAPTEVLEVLVEESAGYAEGAGVAELAPVSKGGRTFRRFLAQDVPANSVLRIAVPAAVSHTDAKVIRGIVIALAAIMGLALAWALILRPRAQGYASASSAAAEALIHDIAALDAAREQRRAETPNERELYVQTRAELGERLRRALASPDASH